MIVRAVTDAGNECPLAGALAIRLREARHDLTLHWLERIVDRVSIERHRVFPSRDLLDHVPLLIDGIADYLEDPSAEVSVDTPVVGKAMELGALRHAQGFDAYEILKEYEILGGILFSFLAKAADEIPEPCTKSELLVCGHRLFRAVSIIQQTTTMHFLRLAEEAVAEREDRLRAFNRAVSHEIKNRIGTVLGASETLREIPGATLEQRDQLLGVISRSARLMAGTVENLVALSRTQKDARQHRHVRLPEAVNEACRQVREAAQAARLDLRTAPDLPDVEVSASVVELCLTNFLANAIKYEDSRKPTHFAEITATVEESGEHGREVVVRVRDNGLGVPVEKRAHLFERFFRAHETVTGAEGTGLGLSIVRETAESLGGRAWAEFADAPAQDGGSVFAFSLPYRRAADDDDMRGRRVEGGD